MASKPPTSKDDQFKQDGIARLRDVLAADEPEWYPAYTYDLEADWERLKCRTTAQRVKALRDAARQVRVEDWDEPAPPGLGTERTIRGARVLQFVYDCQVFGCLMFFRFAFRDGYLYISSLHPADFPKKGQRGEGKK